MCGEFYSGVGISLEGGEVILDRHLSGTEGTYLEASMSLIREEFGMFLVEDVICGIRSGFIFSGSSLAIRLMSYGFRQFLIKLNLRMRGLSKMAMPLLCQTT